MHSPLNGRRQPCCASVLRQPTSQPLQVASGHHRGAPFLQGYPRLCRGPQRCAWVDFNLYGHQFVCHLNPALGAAGKLASHFNFVDGQGVPVPHCGVVLRPRQWHELADGCGAKAWSS